jgi:protein-tyrosine phosphatase
VTSTDGPLLPPPRRPGRYRIGLVCLGNICRSPMAEVVLRDRVDAAGLAPYVVVDSCGTAGWHEGKPMDPRAAATLRAAGLDPSRHRAQQLTPQWFGDHDLLLTMDEQNLANARALAAGTGATTEPERVRLFRDLDPDGRGGEVPDPYYGGDSGFEEVLRMVERTSDALVAALPTVLAGLAGPPAGAGPDAS